MQGNNYQLDKEPLIEIPIYVAKDQIQNGIISHVNQLLQLNQDLHSSNLESKKEQIKQKIAYNEDKINALIYALYDLTAEEIKIIEGN
jgi:adenine-specific DNA-methyltransferase